MSHLIRRGLVFAGFCLVLAAALPLFGRADDAPAGRKDEGGNVWQWCADGYDKYQKRSIKDPKGKEISNGRVLRGGSWGNDPRYCRSAARGNEYVLPYRFDNNGFRVVLRVPARTP